MKRWLMVVALLGSAIQVHAENNASGMLFYRYCMAAADIVGGERKPPTADSMREQLEQASPCFAAVTALMELEPLFAPEFAMCPPAGTKVSNAQVHLIIAEFLKKHPEKLHENFHRLAALAVALTWPCPIGAR
jgi:Rap1a immunity proteins